MKILFFFGTRPEAIKMAPLIHELKRDRHSFDVKICVSAQHREMLDQVLNFFGIKPDFDLNLMQPNQNLSQITEAVLRGVQEILVACKPDWLVVQGDTTTTFAGALAAFYQRVKVAHLEAGLRSFNKESPFPEEMNRVLTTHLSDLHLAPTDRARENLLRENIAEKNIFVVGNTSIDALFLCLDKLTGKTIRDFPALAGIDFSKRIITVTGHRRESFGKPFENICRALRRISESADVELVYPVHLNPNVRKPVFDMLQGRSNVHLIEPLDYAAFVWLMNQSHIILTDSGGVQEEAPSLGKPVLVMRDVTERVEGIAAGTAKLVGTETDKIIAETVKLLTDPQVYEAMAKAVNPYGDGEASRRICAIWQRHPR
ncbi:non-hydrolyzing UDP-N-acetylglucosamine 2-epimerase [Desulfoferrobacter suflitae]|uniref:non-hydrolyzing UDP-N-acetylglucosamine 2-epimerase n=1 Tax=Desulfoferrobacter suflitae TaxID=2865782 RepID=UPI0021648141|nr:UDP-N-acetylglucosamine 2-epimerase (non-hydrolyzing) [Desulfoferrobacter suflitae]MCK8602165.1 UDP-N-acetylglucosamine 2-epimerase (non-hydrolyzing) [Desulfoferrobacter suflitae]